MASLECDCKITFSLCGALWKRKQDLALVKHICVRVLSKFELIDDFFIH